VTSPPPATPAATPAVPMLPFAWTQPINTTVPPEPRPAAPGPEPRVPLHGAWIGYCWQCGLMARVERRATVPPTRAERGFTLVCDCGCGWREDDPVYLPAANLPIP
jgi:hypothetical protein